MEIFKKSIKYSKPLKDLDNKIKKLDEKLKNTGVIDIEDDSEILCIQEISSEKLPKIYDKVEVRKEEGISYNWRESFLAEETDDEPVVEDETYHKTIGRVESYISESNKELIEIRDQVFQEISESTLLNLPEIKCKIEKVLKIYDQLQEGLLNEPPETQNSDPLTPLNQKFVTTEDLNKHYSLFVNRIQEQLSTLGGGGETRLKYLDDIVGIATNASAYGGKYLQWNSTTNKAEFVFVSGSDYASTAGISTVAQGLTGTPNISVGFVTASQLQVNGGGNFTGIVTASSFSGNASSATYATTAGISTYATNAGVSTSVIGGIGSVTQLNVSGNLGIGTVGINSVFSTTDIQSWYYTNKSKSVSGDDGTPQGVYVGAAGTTMFIVGDANNRIIQYALSTPYDVSTAGVAVTYFSTALQETVPTGIDFDPTGTKMFVSGTTGVAPLIVGGDYVHEYSLSTAWTVSSAGYTTSYNVTAQDNTPQGVTFGDSGSKMYVVGNTNDTVYQYSLSTPYSLASGVTYDNISLVLGTNPLLLETNPSDISFNSTGTVLWVSGSSNDRIYEFRLGTAWDISTAVFYDDVYIGFNELLVTGIQVIPGQNIAYIVGSNSDTVFQYSTKTPAIEIASSGISSETSIVLNNETRVKDKLYVKGLAHFDSNVLAQGSLTVDNAITISAGSLTVSGGTITAGNNAAGLLNGNTGTNITMANGQTTGTFSLGGATQTGTMSVGLSTASQITNIQAGANASATTKTINLGTGGLSGSLTQINIGPTAGVGTVVINSGTNLGIGTTNPTSKLTVIGDASISGLTTTNNLYVAGVGTFLSSGLNIRNPANTFGYTIAGDAIAAGYTLTLPVITANTGIAVTGLAQTFTALQTFAGGATISTGAIVHTATGSNFTASSYTIGTVTIGGPSQTGGITLGQSTVSQIVGIATGVSGVGTTKTINLGTGGASGSFTQINIGPTAGVGTVVINSGTNLLVGTTTPTGTASQPLQVTGGGYVSGSVGIGTTNPVATLQVKDALAFETTNTTTSSTSQVAVDTFATATFRSAKYQVQMTCPGQIATLGGITTGGSGYTAGTFNVTFSNSSGTGAAAQGTLTISNGTVSQIGVGTTGGSGYITGDVLTASGGSGLQVSVASTASPSGAILTLGAITSAGIGYTAGVGVGTTTLTFLGGTGTGAVGLATIFDGVITSATLLQQPTTGTGGTVFYSGSNYTTATVLTIAKTDVTNTITDITGSVGVSTFTSLTAHGIGVSDTVRVSSTSNGLTAGTNYFVVTTPTPTTFTLGSSVGIGTTFTTGSSLSIGFYRNSANAGGSVSYLNAITGVSTNYQVSDLLVLQNGTTADFVEYGTIANNDVLGTFAADISGANTRLLLTPTYATNTVKVARQAITV